MRALKLRGPSQSGGKATGRVITRHTLAKMPEESRAALEAEQGRAPRKQTEKVSSLFGRYVGAARDLGIDTKGVVSLTVLGTMVRTARRIADALQAAKRERAMAVRSGAPKDDIDAIDSRIGEIEQKRGDKKGSDSAKPAAMPRGEKRK